MRFSCLRVFAFLIRRTPVLLDETQVPRRHFQRRPAMLAFRKTCHAPRPAFPSNHAARVVGCKDITPEALFHAVNQINNAHVGSAWERESFSNARREIEA